MSTTPPGPEQRAHLHAMWDAVAPNWECHADDVDARAVALTERMLDAVAVATGDRVLELACGPGGLGLAAAARIGASGEVLLSDVAPEMTAIAARRAASRGLTNVRASVLDIEEIAEPDGRFDVVLCREGLMFATDHRRAIGEVARVLAHGGRAAVATWGPRERNPWLAAVLDAVSEQLGVPVPPPGIPGPFSLSDAAQLRALLADAGFVEVDVDEVPVINGAASFDEWWARTTALAGPVSTILGGLPAEATTAIRARAADAVQPYGAADGLRIPGVSLLGRARKP